jgi:hypothetical protein
MAIVNFPSPRQRRAYNTRQKLQRAVSQDPLAEFEVPALPAISSLIDSWTVRRFFEILGWGRKEIAPGVLLKAPPHVLGYRNGFEGFFLFDQTIPIRRAYVLESSDQISEFMEYAARANFHNLNWGRVAPEHTGLVLKEIEHQVSFVPRNSRASRVPKERQIFKHLRMYKSRCVQPAGGE